MKLRRMSIIWMALVLCISLLSTVQPVQAQRGAATPRITVFNTIVSSSFERAYQWSITKTPAASSLTLPVGQTSALDYVLSVDRKLVDTNINIVGSLRVKNYSAQAITINNISVVINPNNGSVVVNNITCPVTLPFVLAFNQEFTCAYQITLPSMPTHLVSVSQATVAGSYGSTNIVNYGAAFITFSAPANTANASVKVYDDQRSGVLFSASSADTVPIVYRYSATIGPYSLCGSYTATNTAYILSDDANQRIAESSAAVSVSVPCQPTNACVLGQGYWKTHAKYGNHPDPTWSLVGASGEDTTFFLSGKSWYQALWAEPRGNAYYILAHQYIAAVLNKLHGANTAQIEADLEHARLLFSTYGPTPPVSGSLRLDFIRTAARLESFNTGKLGPSACK